MKSVTQPITIPCILIFPCILILLLICGCAPESQKPSALQRSASNETAPVPQSAPASETAPMLTNDSPDPIATNVSAPFPTGGTTEVEDRSVWEGVYTPEQSARGHAVYTNACARCHGEGLEGEDVVPELVGDDFLERWNRKRVGNLFSYVKNEMPPKQKNRLTPPEYADVLAYLLDKNKSTSRRAGTGFQLRVTASHSDGENRTLV